MIMDPAEPVNSAAGTANYIKIMNQLLVNGDR